MAKLIGPELPLKPSFRSERKNPSTVLVESTADSLAERFGIILRTGENILQISHVIRQMTNIAENASRGELRQLAAKFLSDNEFDTFVLGEGPERIQPLYRLVLENADGPQGYLRASNGELQQIAALLMELSYQMYLTMTNHR